MSRVLAILLLLAAPTAWSAPAAATGQLSGIVTGQRYGLPVASVSVTLRSEGYRLVQVRQTDRHGAFAFEGLPAGRYSIEAVGAGLDPTGLGPVLVVPGVAVSEHLVVAEPRPYLPAAPRS